MAALNRKDICLAPWCDTVKCEETVKNKSKAESLAAAAEEGEDERSALTGAAKTLCIPFELGKQNYAEAPEKCFACESPAKVTGLWGRSY